MPTLPVQMLEGVWKLACLSLSLRSCGMTSLEYLQFLAQIPLGGQICCVGCTKTQLRLVFLTLVSL